MASMKKSGPAKPGDLLSRSKSPIEARSRKKGGDEPAEKTGDCCTCGAEVGKQLEKAADPTGVQKDRAEKDYGKD